MHGQYNSYFIPALCSASCVFAWTLVNYFNQRVFWRVWSSVYNTHGLRSQQSIRIHSTRETHKHTFIYIHIYINQPTKQERQKVDVQRTHTHKICCFTFLNMTPWLSYGWTDFNRLLHIQQWFVSATDLVYKNCGCAYPIVCVDSEFHYPHT